MSRLRPRYEISLSETQVAELTQLSVSYSAQFDFVQRARIILLAHLNPEWSLHRIAAEVGCGVAIVKKWRYRWCAQEGLAAQARAGASRKFSAVQRAQIIALACSAPRAHGKAYTRWSGEKLRAVAMEQQVVTSISASTIRRWLGADKIKPWRYHSWQKSTDPQFVEKAASLPCSLCTVSQPTMAAGVRAQSQEKRRGSALSKELINRTTGAQPQKQSTRSEDQFSDAGRDDDGDDKDSEGQRDLTGSWIGTFARDSQEWGSGRIRC